MPAFDGRLVGRKLDHRIARATGSLWILEAACPYDEAGAVLLQGRGIGCDLSLVLLLIRDVDTYDPITLRHTFLPLILCEQRYRSSGANGVVHFGNGIGLAKQVGNSGYIGG